MVKCVNFFFKLCFRDACDFQINIHRHIEFCLAWNKKFHISAVEGVTRNEIIGCYNCEMTDFFFPATFTAASALSVYHDIPLLHIAAVLSLMQQQTAKQQECLLPPAMCGFSVLVKIYKSDNQDFT